MLESFSFKTKFFFCNSKVNLKFLCLSKQKQMTQNVYKIYISEKIFYLDNNAFVRADFFYQATCEWVFHKQEKQTIIYGVSGLAKEKLIQKE